MTLPDAEVVAVQWAKANTAISAIVGGKVATALPKDPEMPWLTVFRVTGGVDSGEALLDLPYLQWDCYGRKGEFNPDYATAYRLAATVVEEAFSFSGDIGVHGHIFGFKIISGPRRLDEPGTGWARYVVETQMMTREVV